MDKAINLYNDFFFEFAKSGVDSLEEYIIDKIIFDENPFTFSGTNRKAAENDLDSLQLVSKLDSVAIKNMIIQCLNEKEYISIVERLPEWVNKSKLIYSDEKIPKHIREMKEAFSSSSEWSSVMDSLILFHKRYGCGAFAHYRAFVWERIKGEGFLKGIIEPDSITFLDLIGYQLERSKVVENTEQFLKGYAANNVLIYGDRGTGKSSTVKAILNEYYLEGLRMIEVPKAYLTDFPVIIRDLKNRPQKFIIFVDDLVFADDEENYTALKAILEGGLESKTSNIIIYATSNRRHLIKEYFSERKGLLSSNIDEEVNARDSIQEKLSLADRFGINVVFSSPDQNKYLEIVEGIAIKRNLSIDKETLHKEALKWALWYNGRSARTARQFIDWIEGQEKLSS